MPLIDDLAIADNAKSIRLEVVPLTDKYLRVEAWPAEDLLPARTLNKRAMTPKEWRRIAARLEYPHRKALGDIRFLDGKPFGYPGPIYLRVIASTL